MRAVAFDIRGPWGLFRKPYAPMSPVSFPFPPPTAVMGMVGAICGYAKERYHDEIGWDTFRVGVRLLAPVRTMRAGLNLLNTKGGVNREWRPRADADVHTPIPFEFLVEPAFRVWVTGLRPEATEQLVARLSGPGPVYEPVLGLASCLATVELVAEGEAVEASSDGLHGVVPLEPGVRVAYDPRRPYERLRVPARMDPDRKVDRYPEVVVALDGGAIEVPGGQRWRLGDDVFALL